MSLISFSSHHRQHRAAMYTLKKLLLYDSDEDKIQLLSLLHQLNIEIDSIECDNQNSKSSSTNYNNSYVPIETDNLSALYAHYQIDPQLYPPPDLQLYKTIHHQSFHPSHLYLQSSRLQNNSLSEQRRNSSNNSSERSRSWRNKQKRLRSNRNRNRKKNNNKQVETNNFHYRNMITVRRISCHDILDPQMAMKKRFGYKQNTLKNERIKNKWNTKTKSDNLVENKSQKYKTFPTGFQTPPPLVKLHTSSIQSTTNKSLLSPSTTNNDTKPLTTSTTNTFFQQQALKKKMSNYMSMTGSKVTSLRDSSASSLTSTQLLATTYNQTKPNVTLTSTSIPGSQIDLESTIENSPHLSTTNSSIVPHFSSTIAPYVPRHNSSSATVMPNILTTESIVVPTSTNENIQSLVDQLKTCITTLNSLLQNKTKHGKHIIPDVESCSDEKRNRTKKKQLQSSSSSSSLSLTSTADHLRFSKESISNENNIVFEDITVRRCNSSNNQEQKKHLSNIPVSNHDPREELKRCLLVYCRDRSRNINSNGRQKYSPCTWKSPASNEHSLLSQSSQSIPNISIDDLNSSKSTLILTEEDDDYEPLNELLRMSSL